MAETSRQALKQSIDRIEEMYEFTLAYAAQGLSTDEASRSGAQLRDYLDKAEHAISDLAGQFETVIRDEALTPADGYAAFVEVLRDDSRKASAAIRLTLNQPAISSQLIDNLNASIHVRALLTDIFLLDEVIASREATSATA